MFGSWTKAATVLLLTLGATTDRATAFAPLAVKVNPLTNSRMSSILMAGPPILSEWQILKNGSVVGTIKNHPVIDDGDVITTSPVTNPGDAKANAIVVTSSGSKYKLGKQAKGKAPPAANVLSAAAAASPNNAEAARLAKAKYDLNGQMVGDTYLLAGKPLRSTSGKSTIWTAYLMDAEGMPKGSPLTIKVSSNIESIKREAENYKRVTSGLTKGQFVKCYDYYTIPAGPKKPLVEQCALVMDKGDDDLKAYLVKNGPLTGKQLREAAIAAIQCLQAVHSANLVWTDLKTENFVVLTSKGLSFRGIDLESAMPVLDNPVDYSPEACPPEFADALLEGMGPYFILEYSYDIWSLGMMLFELSTGRPVFDGINPDKVTKMLKNPDYQVDVRAVPDDKLRELVKACLQTDPQRRPSLTQVFLHPYFLTTGFGPFSF